MLNLMCVDGSIVAYIKVVFLEPFSIQVDSPTVNFEVVQ